MYMQSHTHKFCGTALALTKYKDSIFYLKLLFHFLKCYSWLTICILQPLKSYNMQFEKRGFTRYAVELSPRFLKFSPHSS